MTISRKKSAPPIVVDTASGPQSIEQWGGERLNFLYAQYVGCQKTQDHVSVEAAKSDLINELSAYCGVVAKKEAAKRGWHPPGSTINDAFKMKELFPNRADFEDFQSKAVCRAIEKLDTFRGESQFHTWAFTVISNTLMSHVRGLMKSRGISLSTGWGGDGMKGKDDGETMMDPKSAADPVTGTRYGQEQKFIFNAILADQTRDAKRECDKQKMEEWYALYELQSIADQRLIKLWIDGFKPAQISKQLGWPVKTVYNRIAKFKATNPPLISPRPVNLKKCEYNRRSKAKQKRSEPLLSTKSN